VPSMLALGDAAVSSANVTSADKQNMAIRRLLRAIVFIAQSLRCVKAIKSHAEAQSRKEFRRVGTLINTNFH
jgi:hypothetical protein